MTKIHSDLDFLNRVACWPKWPVCPVKKKTEGNSWPIHGLIFAGEGDKPIPVVVMLNLWHPWTKEEYEAAEKHKYDSIEALLADGWEVD